MTAMLAGRVERDAPVGTPRIGTLLDAAAEVVDNITWLEPQGLYQSLNCMGIAAETAMCPLPRGTKSYGSMSAVDGFRTAIQSGITCKAPSLDWSSFPADVQRVFELRETVALERALLADRFTGNSGGAAATDISSLITGDISPKLGIALLAEDAALNYAYQPTFHVPYTVASLLTDGVTLDIKGRKIVTHLGAPVAAGAGYAPSTGPNGAAAGNGYAWLYASGIVRINRGPLVPRTQIDRSTNDGFVLLERVYVVDMDCYLSAVKVKLA